jgi:glycosyltransferase involved in cell wall biosynthesis
VTYSSRVQSQKRPIRLSIITQFYPPDYAATGQLIEELAHRLGEQDIQVQIFTGQPSYAFRQIFAPASEAKGILSIKRSRTSRLWPDRIRGRVINGICFCIRAVLRLLNPSHRPDVLLVTTEPPYLTVVGLFVHIILRIPYICLTYDLYPNVAVALKVVSPNHWLTRFWNQVNCWIWQRSAAIIVLSSTMRDRIVRQCPEIKDKVKVIHSWCDPDLIKPLAKSENSFAQKHGFDRKFTVLYSGNMGRCHDMITIMETALILKDEPIQFVFIGHGAKQKFCLDFVETHHLKNCIFLPYQDRQDLPYSLTACDLSLISIFEGMEGLVAPSKLYSSLASGRPIAVICESHSYLRQIITDACCGGAFHNGESQYLANFILKLASQPALAERLGANGRWYLQQHFTPAKIAREYHQVILNCLQPLPKAKGALQDWGGIW